MPDLAYEAMLDDEHGVMVIVERSSVPDGIGGMKLIVDKADGWLCHNINNYHRLPMLGAEIGAMPRTFSTATIAAIDAANIPRAVAIVPLEIQR